MQFVYPAFLSALIVIAIPLVIHLFNFRRWKRVYFSNVEMLENIEQETKSIKNIKRILILISRILAFVFLVFAFAQPFIPANTDFKKGGTTAIGIYIDNSKSMSLSGSNGNLLEEAKNKAKEIAMSFNVTDKFQLLTNDFEGKHQRLVNRDEFLKLLSDVKVTSASKDMSEIVLRQNSLFANQAFENKIGYYISDYQKSQFLMKKPILDTKIKGNLVQLNTSELHNVLVDSIWFDTPYHTFPGKEKLNVQLKSNGYFTSEYENITIKLFINGVQKSLSTVQINENETKIIPLDYSNLSSGIQNGYLLINDQYVNFDDKFYFSYYIKPEKKVLSIGNGINSPVLDKLFAIDNYFKYNHVSAGNIDYSILNNYDLIILEDIKSINSGMVLELKKSLNNGTNIFVFVANNGDINSYNSLFSELGSANITYADTTLSEVKNLNMKHPFFEGIFEDGKIDADKLKLPVSSYTYKLSGYNKADLLMTFADKSPFITVTSNKGGNFYCCYAPLNQKYSDFSSHSLFVPVLFQSALLNNDFQKSYYVIGKDKIVSTKITELSGEKKLRLKNTESNFEIMPTFVFNSGFANIKVQSAELVEGNYNLFVETELTGAFSFNQDKKESEMNFYNQDELISDISKNGYQNFVVLKKTKKDFGEIIKEQTEGKRYWKQCLIFALIFLLLELILIIWGDKMFKLTSV